MQLPPRISRAEAVGRPQIMARLYDIDQENTRVLTDIEACRREEAMLLDRNHELVAEYERLARKLRNYDEDEDEIEEEEDE